VLPGAHQVAPVAGDVAGGGVFGGGEAAFAAAERKYHTKRRARQIPAAFRCAVAKLPDLCLDMIHQDFFGLKLSGRLFATSTSIRKLRRSFPSPRSSPNDAAP
jgi:hypothetical protein